MSRKSFSDDVEEIVEKPDFSEVSFHDRYEEVSDFEIDFGDENEEEETLNLENNYDTPVYKNLKESQRNEASSQARRKNYKKLEKRFSAKN